MIKKAPLTPEQEYDYYAEPDNQQPQGPPRRRQSRLSEMVPVRFPPELLAEIRRHAEADDRSLSSWIRRAAEHEIRNTAYHHSAQSVTRGSDAPRPAVG